MHFNEGLNYIPFNASLHTKKETNLSKKNQSNSDPSAVTPTKTQSTHPSQISIIIFPNESKNNIFNTKKKRIIILMSNRKKKNEITHRHTTTQINPPISFIPSNVLFFIHFYSSNLSNLTNIHIHIQKNPFQQKCFVLIPPTYIFFL